MEEGDSEAASEAQVEAEAEVAEATSSTTIPHNSLKNSRAEENPRPNNSC